MQPGSLHSRVFHVRKQAFQISQVVLFHHLVSSFFDLFYHLLVLSSLLMGLFRCGCPGQSRYGLDPILEGTQTWKLGHGGSSKEMKREMLSIYIHYTIEVLICQAYLSL